ncbi:MAG: type IV secretion system DNA-binding domain-containing protein [bacterium]|nr:type IV secretion system DNA-binding domain-containing protein [bacterium]MDZ4296466.1 type IV secretion system DNA-binding domain-containing protein [Patescibacteria group bacterium]
MLLLALLLFILFWLFAVGLIVLWHLKKKRELTAALDVALFSVRLPREYDEEEKDWKKFPGVAEQFFASLHSVLSEAKGNFFVTPTLTLEIAVPEAGKEIRFFVAVPRSLAEILEKQIHSFYPFAEVEPVGEDYNIFNKDGAVAVSAVARKGAAVLPIKSYQELTADAVGELFTALSKVNERGEGASIQFTLRPARTQWQAQVRELAQHLKKGESLEKGLKAIKLSHEFREIGKSIGNEVLETATFQQKTAEEKAKSEQKAKEERDAKQKLSSVQEEVLKRIESRLLKPGFEVNVRLVVSSTSENHANELLSHLEGAFGQFRIPQLGALEIRRLGASSALRHALHDFSYRIFRASAAFVLDAEELATIVHFPTPFVKGLPLAYLKARHAPPPPNTPKEGVLLGLSSYRGEEVEVRMARDDRRRHLYVIGQTGVGKSVLLENLIVQDIAAGDGACFIDPHGDAAERILGTVPKERVEDVIYFDPTDIERPMGLNMLEYDPRYPEQKSFIANEVINIFKKIWSDVPEAFGPMFEQYMRNALLLIMEDPASGNTLLEVPRVLADPAFRRFKLSRCANPVVRDFWELEAEKAGGEAKLENMVPYITSKTSIFIANDYMRPIIAQERSAFNFREVMDSGKILIVNLAKGRLGDINAQLLGLIIVGRLLFAALSRTDIANQEERRDFYLYIDEFQNFATESIAIILSEARKYRLNLVIAHQFIAQLIDKIREAVFGNVGSFAAFRVGAQDAEFLEKYMAPVFTKQDLINIDNHNAYVKLLINNFTSEAFNIATVAPTPSNPDMFAAIKEYSRLKYGGDRELIEEEIRERSERRAEAEKEQ